MSTALLFSGQGAQRVGMGHSYYENSPSARKLYNEADEILGWSLTRLSFEGPDEELTRTRVCQPALYVMGYTVYAAFQEQSNAPELKVALGLSLGELTALAVAGVYDFATGLRIVAERGRLMQQACEETTGSMASIIGAPVETVEGMCRDFGIDMANLNCPGQIVISGEKARVKAAVAGTRERGARMAVPLKVAGAYHSRLMESARRKFEAFLQDIPFKPPRLPVFSNVTGEAHTDPAAIKQALVSQVVSPVCWEDCMRNAARLGITRFYECGPGDVLSGLARRIEKSLSVTSLAEFDAIPAALPV